MNPDQSIGQALRMLERTDFQGCGEEQLIRFMKKATHAIVFDKYGLKVGDSVLSSCGPGVIEDIVPTPSYGQFFCDIKWEDGYNRHQNCSLVSKKQEREYKSRPRAKLCKDKDCGVSTGICETTTFGKGELSFNGYWEFPCRDWHKYELNEIFGKNYKDDISDEEYEKMIKTLKGRSRIPA